MPKTEIAKQLDPERKNEIAKTGKTATARIEYA